MPTMQEPDNSPAIADRLFADAELAALYDLFCGARRDFDFYFPRVMEARSVLDIGCGTGALLHRARDAGHTGRLTGLDPAPGMLTQARKRTDIEWIEGDLSTVTFDREFDLIVMTGHAFQVFLTDDDIRKALAAIRTALAPGGRFAFETRNKRVCEWEKWTPENVAEITDRAGSVVRMFRTLQNIDGDVVSFTHTFSNPRWDGPLTSHSTLRFLDAETLESLLADAQLSIQQQYGDWNGSELRAQSPEIIMSVNDSGAPGIAGRLKWNWGGSAEVYPRRSGRQTRNALTTDHL